MWQVLRLTRVKTSVVISSKMVTASPSAITSRWMWTNREPTIWFGEKATVMIRQAPSGMRKESKQSEPAFTYVWFWESRLPERRGQLCRVLARGKLNSILVEFTDGFKVIT